MTLLDWPVSERPRERLIGRGADALSDAELLAVVLRTGVRGRTVVDLARALLGAHGGLRPLLDAELRAFCREPGCGPAQWAVLRAGLELARRYLAADLARGEVLSRPAATRTFLKAWLRGRDREVFAGLFLDNRHRVLVAEELFRGTIDSASVHPREVVKRALACNAAAVIVAHNHPSGAAEPSRADEVLTLRLRDALALIDVRLLDHFIVGEGDPTSLAERGLL